MLFSERAVEFLVARVIKKARHGESWEALALITRQKISTTIGKTLCASNLEFQIPNLEFQIQVPAKIADIFGVKVHVEHGRERVIRLRCQYP